MKEFQFVEEEVQSLLWKQAVVVVLPHKDQIISCLFLVAKKDDSRHSVANLKTLNGFIQKAHFKMESSRTYSNQQTGCAPWN